MQEPIFGTDSTSTSFFNGASSPIVINYNNYLNVIQFNLKENPFFEKENSNKFAKKPNEQMRKCLSDYKFINQSNEERSIASEETCCGPTNSETNTLESPTANLPLVSHQKKKIFQIQHQKPKYISKFYSLLLLVAIMCFFLLFASFPLALLLPKATNNVLITFLQEDDYYCYFGPLIIPLTVIIIYFNWVCMKFFRHS